MDRDKIVKIGDPIRIFRDRMHNPIASYYLVGLTETPCGVALYQYSNQHCTAAFLKDSSGNEVLIEHYDDFHIADAEELRELYEIYSWAFE